MRHSWLTKFRVLCLNQLVCVGGRLSVRGGGVGGVRALSLLCSRCRKRGCFSKICFCRTCVPKCLVVPFRISEDRFWVDLTRNELLTSVARCARGHAVRCGAATGRSRAGLWETGVDGHCAFSTVRGLLVSRCASMYCGSCWMD